MPGSAVVLKYSYRVKPILVHPCELVTPYPLYTVI